MRRGKFRFLLVALLVASGLFSGVEVLAATFSFDLKTDPIELSTRTLTQTYYFNFTPAPGVSTLAIGNVDLEIPENIKIPAGTFTSGAHNDNVTFSVSISGNPTNLSGEVYDTGIGDYGTKFGVGDPRYRVMKINTPNLTNTFTLILTITAKSLPLGTTFATETGTVLIKAGNGSNTLSFFPRDTPAIVSFNGPTLSNISIFPNPTQPPQCATVTWSGTDIVSAVVNVKPPPPATDCVIQPNSDNKSAFLCFVDQGDYTVTVVATGSNGGTSSRSTTLTVSPPPVLETTCKQIRKNPSNGQNPTCIFLCLESKDGSKQTISSATWFNNAECDPSVSEPVRLEFYPKESTVKALVCAPCETTVPAGHPQECSDRIYPNETVPPFRWDLGGIARNCDIFQFENQDQGFAAALGVDPWVVINGSMVWTRY